MTLEERALPDDAWNVIERIAGHYELVKGPGYTLLIGVTTLRSTDYVPVTKWYDASKLENGVPGRAGTAITGPHKWAMIGRLRSFEDTTEVPGLPLTPVPDAVLENGGWYVEQNGEPRHVCDSADAVQVFARSMVAASATQGRAKSNPVDDVVAVVQGSDPIYRTNGQTQRYVVPCLKGEERMFKLVMRVNNELYVVGCKLKRPRDAQLPICGPHGDCSKLYPVIDKRDRAQVLVLPD